MLFVSPLVQAQKVASYDYSDAKSSERLRPPLLTPPVKQAPTKVVQAPSPPRPLPDKIGPGACGGMLGDTPLAISMSLDRESYTVGDEFIFTLVLKVEALHPATIPIRPSIADVEPSDPGKSYKWRPMYINMLLTTADNKQAGIRLLTLYGSPDAPGTEIELRPGEWVEMRGRARMDWSAPRQDSPSYNIAVPREGNRQFSAIAVELRQGSFRYDAVTRQEQQLCDWPAEWSGSGPSAHFTLSPKASSR